VEMLNISMRKRAGRKVRLNPAHIPGD
jgi:hypothetical protein